MVPAQPGTLGLASPWASKALGWHQCQKLSRAWSPLDVPWSLPRPLSPSTLFQVCSTYETVPCRALGMVLRYVDGRVFVTKVLPESQAEVDEVVLAGDILDEINGCSLRYASPGQAALRPAVPGPDQRWDAWWQRGAGGGHPCRAGEELGSAGGFI
ncbi:uncharacterized protein [Anomalospiza imberbis]|uniref:uncharacterized protein isoform X2 n=1 Tax=Anomalospiza imberbis TaxID=187417 RepID=UPI00358F8D6D